MITILIKNQLENNLEVINKLFNLEKNITLNIESKHNHNHLIKY